MFCHFIVATVKCRIVILSNKVEEKRKKSTKQNTLSFAMNERIKEWMKWQRNDTLFTLERNVAHLTVVSVTKHTRIQTNTATYTFIIHRVFKAAIGYRENLSLRTQSFCSLIVLLAMYVWKNRFPRIMSDVHCFIRSAFLNVFCVVLSLFKYKLCTYFTLNPLRNNLNKNMYV